MGSCALLLVASALASAEKAPPSVLFLGNSYTFVNDLDLVVERVLEAGAPGFSDTGTLRLAEGGYRFVDHLAQADGTNGDTPWREALVTGKRTWTWVIFQEQSQIPGFPATEPMYEDSLAAGAVLDSYARDKGASSLLLMTWGRRTGDPDNPDLYPDYLTMQERLAEGYERYVSAWSTTDRPVWIAPAGLAFRHVYEDVKTSGGDPLDTTGLFWKLYQDDGSHPSPLGTYLAACTIYATITGLDPVGLPPLDGLGAKDVLTLQTAAHETVFHETPEIAYPWEKTPKDSGDDTADTGKKDSGDTSSKDSEPPDDSGLDSSHDTDRGGALPVAKQGPCGCTASSFPASWLFSLAAGFLAMFRRR